MKRREEKKIGMNSARTSLDDSQTFHLRVRPPSIRPFLCPPLIDRNEYVSFLISLGFSDPSEP